MAESLWIARLIISARVASKLPSLHQLSADEVRDAVECVAGLTFTWDEDPVRGLRALVEVSLRGMRIVVALYPVNDPMGDVYALGSAYERRN